MMTFHRGDAWWIVGFYWLLTLGYLGISWYRHREKMKSERVFADLILKSFVFGVLGLSWTALGWVLTRPVITEEHRLGLLIMNWIAAVVVVLGTLFGISLQRSSRASWKRIIALVLCGAMLVAGSWCAVNAINIGNEMIRSK